MGTYQCLAASHGRVSVDGSRLRSEALSNRTKGNGHKLMHMKLHSNTRKNFPTVQVTEHWHRLPRKALESPSRERIKNHPDPALCHVL